MPVLRFKFATKAQKTLLRKPRRPMSSLLQQEHQNWSNPTGLKRAP